MAAKGVPQPLCGAVIVNSLFIQLACSFLHRQTGLAVLEDNCS